MTNAAAIGYMIIAARAAGISEETIQQLANGMHYAMDEHTEDEAEDIYQNS